MKRSRRVVLTTLGVAGAAATAGCSWASAEEADAFPYASVAECQAANEVPDAECQTAWNQAQANHEQAAPRFESQQLCEEQFGAGQCQQRVAGTGNYWMPLLAGFMVGRMLDRSQPYYRHGGLYRSRRTNMWYTGGYDSQPLRSSGSGWRSTAGGFDRPSATPPVHTRSSIASRGGFGTRARSGGS